MKRVPEEDQMRYEIEKQDGVEVGCRRKYG